MRARQPRPKVSYNITNKFDFHTMQICEEPMFIDELNALNSKPDCVSKFDLRTHMVENAVQPNVTLDDPTWYYNYLELNLYIVYNVMQKAADGLASLPYMLRIGYVPVCFLPLYVTGINTVWFTSRLNALKIPYVQMPARSFLYSRMNSSMQDVWVAKVDVCEMLGKSPEQVRSRDVIEVLLNVDKS